MSTPAPAANLWATAPSLADIAHCIRRFYCQPATHEPVGREIAPGIWEVLRQSGAPLASVQIRRKGGRYRFEDRPAGQLAPVREGVTV